MSVDLWNRDRALRWRRFLKFVCLGWLLLSVAGTIICSGISAVTMKHDELLVGWLSIILSIVILVILSLVDKGKRRLCQCQNCGSPLPNQVKLCPRCGQLVEHCLRCGYRLVGEHINRCPECGQTVEV
jgi:RNA polymerase subunit RPABC4/transcription elongation factor Spt4